MITVYDTSHALTKGIIECQGEVCESSSLRSPSMVRIGDANSRIGNYLHGEGKDWHRTHEAAVARAEQMRSAKIESLRKQLAKLEAMRFE